MSHQQQPSTDLYLPDESATASLGAAFGRAIDAQRDAILASGLNIFVSGELGAGKTALVRGLLRSLGVTGPIKSPTYALVEPYVVSRLDFYHIDLYRIVNSDEIVSSGFRELFAPGQVCIVEWPERGKDRLPPPDITVALQVQDVGRRAALRANSELGAACLRNVTDNKNGSTPPVAGSC